MVVTGTPLIPNVAHLAFLGSCWTASPGVDPVPSAEDSLWHEDESRAAISYRHGIGLRAAARFLPAILRGWSSHWLRGSPTSCPSSRPQWGQQAAGPAPLPTSAVIAEGFVHVPKERDFFSCMSGWRCNLGFSASAACRYSFMSSGKMLSHRSLQGFRVPVICMPASANGDPWVLAEDTHSLSEIVLTAHSTPIPLLSAGHDRRLFIQPRPPQRGVEGAGRSHGVRRPRRSPRLRAEPGPRQSLGAARLPWKRSSAAGRGSAWPQGRRPGTGLLWAAPVSDGSAERAIPPLPSPDFLWPGGKFKAQKLKSPKGCKTESLCLLVRENTEATQSVPARERELTGSRGP